jgi:hypothetical protein
MHACCADISVFVNAEILKSYLFMELVYTHTHTHTYIKCVAATIMWTCKKNSMIATTIPQVNEQ